MTSNVRIVNDYWLDYDDGLALTCHSCHWSGTADDGSHEAYRDLFDVSCPRCGQTLLVVSYPTTDDMERAARRGVVAARKQLAAADKPVPPVDQAAAVEDVFRRALGDDDVDGAVIQAGDTYVQFVSPMTRTRRSSRRRTATDGAPGP